MDDHISCERGAAPMRMVAAVQGAGTQSVDLLRVVRVSEVQDQLLTNKLLTMVSELIETMADALSEDLETVRECVRHASAALLSWAQEADECAGRAVVEAADRRMYRGGLAPWQVRKVITFIDANWNSSLSCKLLAPLVNLSVSHFARAFK